MNATVWLFALAGAVVAALAFPLAVGPFWILTGLWLALAVGIGSLITGRRSALAWWQFGLVVVLCPLVHGVIQPLIWTLVASRTHSEALQTWLGGMGGHVLSDVLIAFGLREIIKRSAARRGAIAFWLVAVTLGVLHAAVALIWRMVGTGGLPAWSPLASDLVVAFSVLCGYVGYSLSSRSPGGERREARPAAARA